MFQKNHFQSEEQQMRILFIFGCVHGVALFAFKRAKINIFLNFLWIALALEGAK